MSLHGYTVQNHWFNGVCSGHTARPIEHDREVADRLVATVYAQCVDLDRTANLYESGELVPETIRKGSHKPNESPTKPWAEGSDYEREREVKSRVWNTRNHASAGRDFAKTLQQITNTFHGKELQQVERAEAPAPILSGERRELNTASVPKTVATVTRVDRSRVYWKATFGDSVRQGWTGTQAWRKLNKVEK
jgi:hypothetical protein